MKRRGRPGKYETNVKPRFDEITEWLSIGATEKEIAKNLGINIDTWIEYKKTYSELTDPLKVAAKIL